MSSFHRRNEGTEGQHTQAPNNSAGLNQHDLLSDQHPVLSIGSSEQDVDQSVRSRVNDGTSPTSTCSHSNRHDTEPLMPGTLPNPRPISAAEVKEISDKIQEYMIKLLTEKVLESFGWDPSSVSGSSSSSGGSSDEDDKESNHCWPASGPGDESTGAEPHSSPTDANSESTRPLAGARLTGKRKQSAGDEAESEDGEQVDDGGDNPRPLKSSRLV